MPFRTNFFGEQIAQPGTTRDDIEQMLVDKHGCNYDVQFGSADLFTNGDDEFKFGGELHIVTMDPTFDENEDEIDEPTDREVAFDGFASAAEARLWVTEMIGVGASHITEVS